MAIGIGNRAVRVAQIAYAERIGNDQDKMHAAIEAALLQLVGDVPALPAVRKCRVCGCTDDEACPGGCSWSQPEICSTCAARQHRLDEQYLTTLREQEHAAKLQSSQVLAQLDFIAHGRSLIDEQTEVAKMQREEITGVTWRQAVACAAEGAGSPTEDDGVHERIAGDAEWFAHLLG
ncbi:MAG TPA: hypothetical protein VLL08_04250, partial [Kineosporiaceae bacterium]|nr:hypothetical protein [Kineosporiaceae bacterium]